MYARYRTRRTEHANKEPSVPCVGQAEGGMVCLNCHVEMKCGCTLIRYMGIGQKVAGLLLVPRESRLKRLGAYAPRVVI